MQTHSVHKSLKQYSLQAVLGPIYMISGTRNTLQPELLYKRQMINIIELKTQEFIRES